MKFTRKTSIIAAVGVILAAILARAVLPTRSAAHSHNRVPGKMRIVSLSPGSTEMLFSLGLGDSIVGVTQYCNYPPEAKKIERVGGYGTPNIEKLLDLSPDLVVAAGFDRRDVLQTLEKSGVRVLELPINSINDMFHALQQIGDATDKHQEAKAIVASLQNNLNRIHEQARRHSPPRVFLELWDDPLTTVGQGSFVDDIISRAGGVNVAHDISHPHPRISAEKVIAWNPDVIIVAHMAREASPTAAIAHRIGWSDIQAVRQGHVICNISTDILLRPGPRLIEGVNVLAQRFNAMDTTAQPAVYTTEQKKP